MQRFVVSLAATVGFVALLSAAAPAHAAFRTFVSGSGSDASDCLTPTTACRQLFGASGALSKTDAFGLISVFPGAYSGFTVDKTLEIIAEGGLVSVEDSIPLPGGGNAGILVDGNVVVRIRGFEVHTGTSGIALLGSGGILHVENSVLVPDAGGDFFGIDFRPDGASELYVTDTIVSASGHGVPGGGIRIKPSGSGSAKVVLDNVKVNDDAIGVLIDGASTSGTNSVTISNSDISGSGGLGLKANDSGGGSTNVFLEQSTISNNTTNGVVATGANATIRLGNSTVTGNAKGLNPATGGKIISQGGNVVRGNTVNGTFTSTEAQQ